MNTVTALAQSSDTIEWTPIVVVIMMSAMALLLSLVRLLRRFLALVTRVVVSAGVAMTGFATVLAIGSMLTTLLLVYAR